MIHKRKTASGMRYDVRLRRPDGTVYSHTFRTRAEAERWERTEIRARDRGDWIDPSARATKLADWVERWLAQPGRRPATTYGYRRDFERDVLPTLGGHALGSITPADIQSVMNAVAVRVRPHTVHKVYRSVKACFSAAVTADLIARSPCRGVKLPSPRSELQAPATFSAVDSIAAWLPPHCRVVAILAGFEGLRRGEIFGLQVRDLDLLAGVLHIRRAVTEEPGAGVVVGPPKTVDSLRSIRLVGPTREALAAHLALRGWTAADGDRYLLGTGDGSSPASPSAFYATHYDPARKAAGYPRLKLHDLRRLAATELMAAGVDLRTVQGRLGHASALTTMTYYARVNSEAEARAVERFEEHLFDRRARYSRDDQALEPRRRGLTGR